MKVPDRRLSDFLCFFSLCACMFISCDYSATHTGEADLAAAYVHLLFQAGLREHGMAIITPYSAQVEKLRSRLRERYPDLEIGTVVGPYIRWFHDPHPPQPFWWTTQRDLFLP